MKPSKNVSKTASQRNKGQFKHGNKGGPGRSEGSRNAATIMLEKLMSDDGENVIKAVAELDPAYVFDPETTLAILAGFAHNRRVMIQGYHGTGKSTHIEQVAARLNWPCVRINLDSHISRIDLIGKDAIVLKDGQQITEFTLTRCSSISTTVTCGSCRAHPASTPRTTSQCRLRSPPISMATLAS